MTTSLQTYDNIHNVMTGIGSAHSKRAHNHYDYSYMLDYTQLEAGYQNDFLCRAVVDIPVEDMTREWRDFTCENGTELKDAEKLLQIRHSVTSALKWSRLYGGAIILMITDQPLDQPLDVNKIKKGSLKRLMVADRYMVSTPVLNVWDITASNFMLPNYYYINGGGTRIHHSHVVRFIGAELPFRLNMQTLGWGDSELRKCLEQIKDFTASNAGIAELMAEANVDIITRQGLTDEIASKQEEAIIKRYAVFNQMKSVVQMALLDSEETYDRKTLNLSGIAPIIELFMTIVSGASGIPKTRLFGEQAKGLGNDGSGDMSNYYNHIRSKQVTQLDPSMHNLDQVFVRSTLGYYPEDFAYIWNPLEQLNDKEVAEAGKIRADRDNIYLQQGVISVSQIQRNLQQDDTYQFDDEEIEALAQAEKTMTYEEPEQQQTTDSTFVESEHPRDDDGKFTKGGGTSASSSDQTRYNLKDLQAEADNVVRLWHGSPDKTINEIKQSGVFGGLFMSTDMDTSLSHAANLHFSDIKKEDIGKSWEMEEMAYDDEHVDKVDKVIDKFIVEDYDDDQFEQIKDMVLNDRNIFEEDNSEEISLLLGYEDVGEASWELQNLRGRIASVLGFKAVEMDDEHGTSYLVLPGVTVSGVDV